MRLIFLCLFLLTGFSASAQKSNIVISPTLLVCQKGQCAGANYTMTRAHVLNLFIDLLEKNMSKNIQFCAADPSSRVCYDKALTVPVVAGVSYGDIKLYSMQLNEASLIGNDADLALLLTYHASINNKKVVCQASRSTLLLTPRNKAQIRSNAVDCSITQTGKSLLSITFSIDFVDFDNGLIGAYYNIGITQTTKGEKMGYALLRFSDNIDVADDLKSIAPLPLEAQYHQQWLQHNVQGKVAMPDKEMVRHQTVPVYEEYYQVQTEPIQERSGNPLKQSWLWIKDLFRGDSQQPTTSDNGLFR